MASWQWRESGKGMGERYTEAYGNVSGHAIPLGTETDESANVPITLMINNPSLPERHKILLRRSGRLVLGLPRPQRRHRQTRNVSRGVHGTPHANYGNNLHTIRIPPAPFCSRLLLQWQLPWPTVSLRVFCPSHRRLPFPTSSVGRLFSEATQLWEF